MRKEQKTKMVPACSKFTLNITKSNKVQSNL